MAACEEAFNGGIKEAIVVNTGSKVGVVELDLLVSVESRGRLSLVHYPTFDQVKVHSDCKSEKKIQLGDNLDNKMSPFLTHHWNS